MPGYALAAASRGLIAVAGRWLAARLIDRTGKGMRSAPRDAIIADVTPVEQRGFTSMMVTPRIATEGDAAHTAEGTRARPAGPRSRQIAPSEGQQRWG